MKIVNMSVEHPYEEFRAPSSAGMHEYLGVVTNVNVMCGIKRVTRV